VPLGEGQPLSPQERQEIVDDLRVTRRQLHELLKQSIGLVDKITQLVILLLKSPQ
jgi:hypothetical protein